MKIIDTNVQILPLKYLHENTGQIEGVPANPRILRDSKYRALLESLKKDDLTGVLPLKIYEKQAGEYIVLGGNMRLKALRELHDEEWAVSCVKIPEGTPAEVLRKIVVLDNSTFGEWDMDLLANDWDTQELADWGVEIPFVPDEVAENENPAEKEAQTPKSEIIIASVSVFGQGGETIVCEQIAKEDAERLLQEVKTNGAQALTKKLLA